MQKKSFRKGGWHERSQAGVRSDDIGHESDEGIEWVVLTNGIIWRLYYVLFSKPIDKTLIAEIDLTTIDCREESQRELLFLFTKEGFKRGAQTEMRDRKDATSRYLLAALVLNNDRVLNTIRRELRRVVEVNVEEADIANVLRDQVVKRDALEGPEAEEASKRVQRRSDRSILKPHEEAADTTPAQTPTTSS